MRSKSNRSRTAIKQNRKAQDGCDTGAPIAEEPPVRIDPGNYEAVCYKVKTGPSFGGRRKLFVKFRLYGGKYNGTELFMACPYPNGRIRHTFKLYKQWCLAMGRLPKKGERISGKAFPKKMYEVLVRDTKCKLPDGTVMPAFMQYSVVDSIISPHLDGQQL